MSTMKVCFYFIKKKKINNNKEIKSSICRNKNEGQQEL